MIPGVFNEGSPSIRSCAATPHVIPTDFAMPEYPYGSPSSSRVDVRVSFQKLANYIKLIVPDSILSCHLSTQQQTCVEALQDLARQTCN